jgi:hypothetical protein
MRAPATRVAVPFAITPTFEDGPWTGPPLSL